MYRALEVVSRIVAFSLNIHKKNHVEYDLLLNKCAREPLHIGRVQPTYLEVIRKVYIY